jgi:hypothetical protein
VAPADVPRPASGVTANPLDDELVVCTPGAVQGYVLNTTAAVIWDLCDGTRNVASVAEGLASMYALEFDRALADVTTCLEDLVGLGLVRCQPVTG